MLRNTPWSWGLIARIFHWAVAAIILFQLGLGLWSAYLEPDQFAQIRQIQVHKSWGFLVFWLAVPRVLWRISNKAAPALPVSMGRLERFAAKAGHLGLYVLMLAMPLTGWLMATASPLQEAFGLQNRVFGLFEMYDPFVPGNRAVSEFFSTVHFLCAMALALLLAGHVGAALMHHFIKKDDVLRRMTFGPFR